MRKFVFIAICVFGAIVANAQKISYTGSLTCLKNEKAVNYQFTYDNMKVGDMSETDYISKKKDEAEEKHTGRGDVWLTQWESDKKNVFPQKFKELFEKYGKIAASDEPQKYTLIVNTDFLEPGFNAIAVRRDAMINLTIKIVETENPENIVATVTVLKSPGSTFWGTDISVADRVGEAYAKAGKDFGATVAKYCKK
ncbi:MAG: hypothetical protein IKZ99_05575 [Salinivirgaceae bacterium]|nr:hypothetical protein [Salinivirgaceae bacterium]